MIQLAAMPDTVIFTDRWPTKWQPKLNVWGTCGLGENSMLHNEGTFVVSILELNPDVRSVSPNDATGLHLMVWQQHVEVLRQSAIWMDRNARARPGHIEHHAVYTVYTVVAHDGCDKLAALAV